MNNPFCWIRAGLLGLVIGLVGSPASAATPTSRPNLLLIIADDLTRWDTSVYGGQAATPHLEKLAAEGMMFTRCYQAAPSCSPTRHALYTSLYPVKSGAHPNHTFVKDGVRSVAHWLKDAGYRAALSGKTHINPPASFPFEYSDERSSGSTNPDFPAVDKFLGECAANKTPFGLILCSNEPHTPWNLGDPSAYPPSKVVLPPVYPDTPETRADFSKYLAEITYFDAQVGRALALLKQHHLEQSTIVVVLTEQGNSFPFAKWTCYDAGLGSGLIVRWPGRVAPGTKSSALVEYIDIMPTFLQAAGIAVPAGLDGRSFLPVLENKASSHKEYVFGMHTTRGIINGSPHFGIRSVRDARYRYIRNLTPEVTFTNATTRGETWDSWLALAKTGNPTARTAVERYQHRPAEELYDVEADQWNTRNLIADTKLAPVKARLSAQLDNWMKAQGDLGQATELDADNRLWRSQETGKAGKAAKKR